MAFGKAKQPFFRLLELAESLCSYAKDAAKDAAKREAGTQRPASTIAFHRVTESALGAGAAELFERLTVPWGRRERWCLTAQPFRVGAVPASKVVECAALQNLRQKLDAEGLKAGRLRELRSLLLQGFDDQSEEAWRRWRAMAKKRSPLAFAEFEGALNAAAGSPDLDLCFYDRKTPLFDAVEWRAIG